jgi:hypothetical protein
MVSLYSVARVEAAWALGTRERNARAVGRLCGGEPRSWGLRCPDGVFRCFAVSRFGRGPYGVLDVGTQLCSPKILSINIIETCETVKQVRVSADDIGAIPVSHFVSHRLFERLESEKIGSPPRAPRTPDPGRYHHPCSGGVAPYASRTIPAHTAVFRAQGSHTRAQSTAGFHPLRPILSPLLSEPARLHVTDTLDQKAPRPTHNGPIAGPSAPRPRANAQVVPYRCGQVDPWALITHGSSHGNPPTMGRVL